MKVIVQRTLGHHQLAYDDEKLIHDGVGLVVLWGWMKEDGFIDNLDAMEEYLLDRVMGLRIFPDANDKMNLGLKDYAKISGQKPAIFWVPQFTLAAEMKSGYRPSYTAAMNSKMARMRFAILKNKVEKCGLTDGISMFFGGFAADMTLTFTNWGPVTIPLG